MTLPLVAGVAVLALLDSLNPATLVAVTLILLGSRRHPVAETLGFVAGAFCTVLAVGLAIYFGAEATASVLDDGLVWLRRVAFGLPALMLFILAVRALRPRRRASLRLPSWFNPGTAVALGVVMTGADLPNAFPYFIAIERLVNAQVTTAAGVLTLVGYALVYCLPCLVLLALGLAHGERVHRHLRRLHGRFGTDAELPASRRRAALLFSASLAMSAVATTA